jgi:hypothetical protein
MRQRITIAAALAAMLATPVVAQPRGGAVFAPGHTFTFRMSPALDMAERALRVREDLELSDDQVARIDALRQEELERLAAGEREMRDRTSRMRAGLLDEDSLGAYLRQHRDAQEDAQDQARGRLEEILTEEQREELREWRGPWRAGAMGPRGSGYGRVRVMPRFRHTPGPGWYPDYWRWDGGYWRRGWI